MRLIRAKPCFPGRKHATRRVEIQEWHPGDPLLSEQLPPELLEGAALQGVMGRADRSSPSFSREHRGRDRSFHKRAGPRIPVHWSLVRPTSGL